MCDKVCQDIARYLLKHKNQNESSTNKDYVLVIQVKEITSETNEFIPKLEYKSTIDN